MPPKYIHAFVFKVMAVLGLNPEPVMLIMSPTLPVVALSAIVAVVTVNVAVVDSYVSETVTVYEPVAMGGTVNVVPAAINPESKGPLPIVTPEVTC